MGMLGGNIVRVLDGSIMNVRERSILRAALLCAVAFTVGACRDAGDSTNVSRRVVADTTFVSSPEHGTEGPVVLQEVLRIDASLLDGRVTAGAFGTNGTVWLFDEAGPAGARIVVFDSLGARRVQAGRHGSGPGEYRAPLRIVQLADGSMLAKEMTTTRAVRFDENGAVLATIELPAAVATGWVVTPDTIGGWFITAPFEPNTPTKVGRFAWLHFNSAGQVIDTVHPPRHMLEEPTPDGIAPGRIRTVGRDGAALTTVPGPNRLTRYARDGSAHVFEWPGEPQAYLDAERVDVQAVEDRMSEVLGKAKASLPERKQPAHRILTDGTGLIWAQLSSTGRRIPDDELPPGDDPFRMKWRDDERWAAFQSDGALRFIVDLRSNQRVLDRWGHRLLVVEADDDGAEHVAVLRVVGARR